MDKPESLSKEESKLHSNKLSCNSELYRIQISNMKKGLTKINCFMVKGGLSINTKLGKCTNGYI